MSKKKPPANTRLERYRSKRSAQSTPEPFGSQSVSRPRLFVVQKHAATRLHYDFRLEWGGTLLSWAVPKGPSMDPADKRYAVQVEDHPVDYADFEGIIPKNNYGAGAVIVWDKGLWWPLDDPEALERTGKLHFQLRGYKLRGEWYLVRMQGKDWLLRKKADEWATTTPRYGEESIHSGLTLEELRDGHNRAATVTKEIDALGAAHAELDVMNLELVLAETAEAPFSSPDWLFELKYDGYRILASRGGDGRVILRSRNGHDLSATFPEITRALRALPYDGLVVDGELVVLDDEGRSNFGELQKRAKLNRAADIERGAVECPVTYFVFDLLGFGGRDLRPLPLYERKRLLQPLLPRLGPVRFADHVEGQGVAMFEKIRELGLEGVIAKRRDAPYRGGRSSIWQKIVADRTGDFVVCGYTLPRGSRQGFGALHLGVYEGDVLVYAGRVGSGFSDQQLNEMRTVFDVHRRDKPPCDKAPASGREHRWLEPEWVAEVRYKQVTREGLLRAPVFVRLRSDKSPQECRRTGTPHVAETEPEAPRLSRAEKRSVKFTNLDKVFFPEHRYTKGDLIDYYRRVSEWMLPYLCDRPLVLTRYPDGIHGKSFYQKNAPEFAPGWIERVSIWSDSSEREIEYFVCNDLDTLLYIANMGAIPLHVWPSRASNVPYPDFCILDLDPKEAPFRDVITLALAIRRLCDEIGLPTYVKTTGSSGLHILVPLGGQCTFEQSRMLGQLISRLIATEHPEVATIARTMAARQGRVYLDFLQNRHGQLIVAPYTVRPIPGAPVSAPIDWKEVNARLTPQQFTIANLPARLARKKKDPLLPVLDERPDLVGALARLAARLQAKEKRRAT